jgi:hypothetical protein
MRVWELGPGRLMVAGAFSDLAIHHHPAVQVSLGGQGSLTVTRADDTHDVCRLVVIGSGTRHAVRSDAKSAGLTLYLGLQTWQGMALNTLSRKHGQHEGIWIVDDEKELADATAALLAAEGPHAAADFLVDQLCERADRRSDGPEPIHPQLKQAIEVVSNRMPDHVDVASVADAVALFTGLPWATVQTTDRRVVLGHDPLGAAGDRGELHHRWPLRHRCRPPGRVCRRFARQPGVLGNDRGGPARLRTSGSRIPELTDPYKRLRRG